MLRFFALLLILVSVKAKGQDSLVVANDTVSQIAKNDSIIPRKSLLRSLILPGWGQYTNRQVWKSPLYLGGVGTGIFAFVKTNNEYKKYQTALNYRMDDDTSTIDIFSGILSTSSLLVETSNHKRIKNFASFGTFFVYGLNVLDAYIFVDQNKNVHSPGKAVYYAALFPGLGQIYNRKYWKLPIVYAAFGTAIYFAYENGKRYNDFRFAYITRTDNDPLSIYETEETIVYSRNQDLISIKDYYKRNMELSYLAITGVYLLNIIDALVDGHLYNFDISDDLSFKVSPILRQPLLSGGYINGLRLNFGF